MFGKTKQRPSFAEISARVDEKRRQKLNQKAERKAGPGQEYLYVVVVGSIKGPKMQDYLATGWQIQDVTAVGDYVSLQRYTLYKSNPKFDGRS